MTAPIMARLGPVAIWFPDRVVRTADLPELVTLPPARQQQVRALGIEEVRCADGLTEVDLAARAATAALADAGLSAAELDALILVQGRAPEYLLASEATRLQARIGASRALTFGVGELGCVSVSAALNVASGLLHGPTRLRHVLVAMGARTPTAARYRAPMTVLGDGGAAVLLTPADGPGTGRFTLVDQLLRSDGQYADLFRIDYRDVPSPQWVETCADESRYSFRLAMTSRSQFAALNRELLTRHGLTPGDLSAVLMQNLAAGAFAFWQDALDLKIADVCRQQLARYGHLGSIDVLLNLEAVAPSVPPGGWVLVMNSSPVAAWCSALLRRLPETTEGA